MFDTVMYYNKIMMQALEVMAEVYRKEIQHSFVFINRDRGIIANIGA